MGKTIEGLYLLQFDSLQQHYCISLVDFLSTYKLGDVFSPYFFATATHCSLSSLRHARLGHLDPKLHALSHVFPVLQNSCNKDCIVCPMGKQKRLPYPFNNKLSTCTFDLVHMDVWGPYSTPTLEGFKYFLTMVDDSTRATWIFFMKSKSEVRQLITSFYTMIHTQFGVKIKSVRTNNAMEFHMPEFYSSNGIIH